MKQLQHDPLSDYFTSEWTISLSQEPHVSSSDFSAAVLTKIVVNRRKERLFNLVCLSIALAGIAATVVFVYPGYKQLLLIDWRKNMAQWFHTFSNVANGVQSAFHEVFLHPIREPESLFMTGMFTYLVLLAAALWGVDWLLRRGHIVGR